MSDSRLSEQELADLETLIDRRGIEDVLIAVSEICGQDFTRALRRCTLREATGL